jgi:hypothetical protein
MTASEEENALRLFLEDAVPHLAAPVQRIQQVRRRVQRRRRRRTALAAAAGVVVVAALTTLLRPGSGAAPQVTPADAGSLTLSPTTTADAGRPSVTFLGDLGMTVTLPGGWYAAGDYVADRALQAPAACARPEPFACSPLTTLADGDALIYFGLVTKPHKDVRRSFDMTKPQAPDTACRALGGDAQFFATAAPPGDYETYADVCLRHAAVLPTKYAHVVLQSAVFSRRTVPPPTISGH